MLAASMPPIDRLYEQIFGAQDHLLSLYSRLAVNLRYEETYPRERALDELRQLMGAIDGLYRLDQREHIRRYVQECIADLQSRT